MNFESSEDETVSDFLFGPCSTSLLAELALEDEYWERVENFVTENEDTALSDLTENQRNWVFRIRYDLIEKAGGH